MTVVIGLQHEGTVYLGGDSAAIAGSSITAYGAAKVFARDGYILGFAASFRAGQLLQHHVNLPPLQAGSGKNLDAFMVREVIPAIRECYVEYGVSAAAGDQQPGWPILMGVSGVLYHVDYDWAAHRSRDGYMAIGIGEELALGSLHSTRKHPDPAQRIRLALQAAAHHNAAVCKPFKVLAA